MAAERKTLFPSLALAAYRAFNGGAPVLLGLFIAHRWGLTDLAAFTLANAILAVAIVFGDGGSSRLLPRELARGGPDSEKVLATSSAIRLTLVAVTLLISLTLSWNGRIDSNVFPYLVLMLPIGLLSVAVNNAICVRVVEADMRGVPMAIAAGLIPVCAGALAASWLPGGVMSLVACYSVGKSLEAGLLLGGRTRLLLLSVHEIRRTFLLLLPFGASAVISTVYARLPVFVTSHWASWTDLGVISAATALQNILLLVPTAMAAMSYPRVAQSVQAADREALRHHVLRYAATALPVLIVGVAILAVAIDVVCAALHVPPRDGAFVVVYASLACLATASTMAGAVLQAFSRETRVATIGLSFLSLAVPVQIFATARWGLWGTLSAIVLLDGSACLLLSALAWRRWTSLRPDGWSDQTARPM